MKRDILRLNQPAYRYLAELVQNTTTIPEKTTRKFSTDPTIANQQLKLQLSVEEVESLLDALPMPKKNEDATTTSVRQKLQQFLTDQR